MIIFLKFTGENAVDNARIFNFAIGKYHDHKLVKILAMII